MKSLIQILLVLCFPGFIFSQLTQEWATTYSGTGTGVYFYDVCVEHNNNIYVAGVSISSNYDALVVKFDPSGVLQWDFIFRAPSDLNDIATRICVDDAGFVYTASTSDGDSTSRDVYVIKLNPAGTVNWIRKFDGAGHSHDYANSIALYGSDIYLGLTSTGVSSLLDIVTVKYDSSGTLKWARSFNGSANLDDRAAEILCGSNGNVVIVGEVESIGSWIDFCTIKYDSEGNELWHKIYNGEGNAKDWATDVDFDHGGNVLVTGTSSRVNQQPYYYGYLTIKYNTNGDSLWVRRFSAAGNADSPTDLRVSNQGKVVVTGYSYVNTTFPSNPDFCTVQYDANGILEWYRLYGGPNLDYAEAVTLDTSGNVFVCGYSRGITSFDCTTLQYNSSGTLTSEMKYNNSSSTGDWGFKVFLKNNFVVTAGWTQPYSNTDGLVIKYSKAIGIIQIGSQIPSMFSLEQNYPNPFNSSTNILFDVHKPRNVSIKIYGLNGREVQTLVNQTFNPGRYKIVWDASAFPSGVYFYTMRSGSFSESKKMILLK